MVQTSNGQRKIDIEIEFQKQMLKLEKEAENINKRLESHDGSKKENIFTLL